MNPSKCSLARREDLAEEYALRRLSDRSLEAFEKHLIGCSFCREEVQFVRDLRDALKVATCSPDDELPPLPLRGGADICLASIPSR